MSWRLDEVFKEYRDVPISRKKSLANEYAAALRSTGEMSDEEIEEEVEVWLDFDEKGELRGMYGLDDNENLDEVMEDNNFFRD